MDYKKLLIKYINHVLDCEGCNYISNNAFNYSAVEFNDREKEMLKQLDSENNKSKS